MNTLQTRFSGNFSDLLNLSSGDSHEVITKPRLAPQIFIHSLLGIQRHCTCIKTEIHIHSCIYVCQLAWPNVLVPYGDDNLLQEVAISKFKANSAASSFALLRFCPSYQNLAGILRPSTITVLDHAVLIPKIQSDWIDSPRFVNHKGPTSSFGHNLKYGRVNIHLSTFLCDRYKSYCKYDGKVSSYPQVSLARL